MKVFNFLYKSIQKNFSECTLEKTMEFIKNRIIEQAKTELSGEEKKSNVDRAVVCFIKSNIVSVNPIVNALINVLVDYVPTVTQCIYEYLKKYVDGLTEG